MPWLLPRIWLRERIYRIAFTCLCRTGIQDTMCTLRWRPCLNRFKLACRAAGSIGGSRASPAPRLIASGFGLPYVVLRGSYEPTDIGFSMLIVWWPDSALW